MSSVLFAIFLALIMRSMQLGSYKAMIVNSVKSSTGYIQIHGNGYWDDKIIDNTLYYTDELQAEIDEIENVSLSIPRLESFTLASSGKHTKGAAVIGTIPELEDQSLALKQKLIKGDYLEAGARGALISAGLADYLELDVKDTLVLLSQGYHGVSAYDAIPVTGIVEFVQPDMNNQMIYVDLEYAQYFYDCPGRLTSISLMLDNPDKLEQTRAQLQFIDPDLLEVMTWKEMLTELVQSIQGDNVGGLFMLGILYMVVGFGIFGTILMMTLERKRELGIMIAVGMRRFKLSSILFFETIMIGLMGIIAGAIVAFPVLLYFYYNPILLTGEAADAMKEFNMEPVMPFLLEPGFFVNQGLVVVVLTLIIAFYPLLFIRKLKVIDAIKGR